MQWSRNPEAVLEPWHMQPGSYCLQCWWTLMCLSLLIYDIKVNGALLWFRTVTIKEAIYTWIEDSAWYMWNIWDCLILKEISGVVNRTKSSKHRWGKKENKDILGKWKSFFPHIKLPSLTSFYCEWRENLPLPCIQKLYTRLTRLVSEKHR